MQEKLVIYNNNKMKRELDKDTGEVIKMTFQSSKKVPSKISQEDVAMISKEKKQEGWRVGREKKITKGKRKQYLRANC